VPMQTAEGGEFVSPSGNISCEVDYGRVGLTTAYCQTGTPPRSVTMSPTGTYTTCSGQQCLGNVGPDAPILAYGTATGVGPFRCESATTGITCTAVGRGFRIASSGITPLITAGVPANASSAVKTAPPATALPTMAPLPLLSIPGNGRPGYSGRYPTEIDFSRDSGNILSGISWSSWGAEQATGHGSVTIQNCVPDCASGAQTPTPTTVMLSNPAGGVYRTITESIGPNRYRNAYTYGTEFWPLGAQ
jgi:hypothetical protein